MTLQRHRAGPPRAGPGLNADLAALSKGLDIIVHLYGTFQWETFSQPLLFLATTLENEMTCPRSHSRRSKGSNPRLLGLGCVAATPSAVPRLLPGVTDAGQVAVTGQH